MLTLPIKKKWFDMIVSGEKKEEYREIKPYWTNRFYNNFNDVTVVLHTIEHKLNYIAGATGVVAFKNGYDRNAPKIECFIKLRIGQGKEEWGAEPNKEYYILEILEIMKGE